MSEGARIEERAWAESERAGDPPWAPLDAAGEVARVRATAGPRAALARLPSGSTRSTPLRVEEALCHYALGDFERAAAAVDGDAAAARAMAPLLAAVEGGEVPRARKGSSVRAKAVHELARGIGELRGGQPVRALGRFRKIPVEVELDVAAQVAAIEVGSTRGRQPQSALTRLVDRARGDPELDAAVGRHIGRTFAERPLLAQSALRGRWCELRPSWVNPCRAALAAGARAESGSPSALLEVHPGSVPEAYRGALHLHRGFALLAQDPKRAERELDAALARGADPLEVLRGRNLAATSGSASARALERLHRAALRSGVPEAGIVTGHARLERLVGSERWSDLPSAVAELEQLRDARGLASKRTDSVILRARYELAFRAGRWPEARDFARRLTEVRPGLAFGWLAQAELEEKLGTSTEAILSLYHRARQAIERGAARDSASDGPEAELEMLEREERALRKRKGLFVAPTSAGAWARAYLEGGSQEDGAPSPSLAEAHARLSAEDQRACLVVEAIRRAQLDRLAGWLPGVLFAEREGQAFEAIVEAMNAVDPALLRRLARELDGATVERIVQAGIGETATVVLFDNAARIPAHRVAALKRVAGRRSEAPALEAAKRRLAPHVSLDRLIEEGLDFEGEDEIDLGFEEQAPFEAIKRLFAEIGAGMVDPGPGPGARGGAFKDTVPSSLRGLYEMAQALDALPEKVLRDLIEELPFEGPPLFELPVDGAPFRLPGARPSGASARAERKNKKKREKQNRKRGRGRSKK